MRITDRGKLWETTNSIWILWSFCPLLYFVGFFWIGARAKQIKWSFFGCLYMFALFLVTVNAFFWVIAWIASIAHSFYIRDEYLKKRDAFLKAGQSSEAPAPKAKAPTAKTSAADSNIGLTKAEAVIKQGKEYIKELNALNISIVDIKLSEQMDELETISKQIFDFISENQDNVKQIDQFMEYYFPQLIKLLTSYKNMALQQIKVEQMQIAMQKIESVMDSMVTAFKNQLNNLYENKALDIKTDIDVLNMMLSQHGLDK